MIHLTLLDQAAIGMAIPPIMLGVWLRLLRGAEREALTHEVFRWPCL